VPQEWFYVQKFGEVVMGRGQNIGTFISCRTGRPCAMAGRLGTAMGTGHAIGTHTGAGVQCADAVETSISADGPAHILHTGMGSGGAGRAKSRVGLPT